MLPMPRIVRPDPSRRSEMKVGSPAEFAPANPLSRTKNWRDIPASYSTGQEISRDVSLSAFRKVNRRSSILDRAEGERRCLASRFLRPMLSSKAWHRHKACFDHIGDGLGGFVGECRGE